MDAVNTKNSLIYVFKGCFCLDLQVFNNISIILGFTKLKNL